MTPGAASPEELELLLEDALLLGDTQAVDGLFTRGGTLAIKGSSPVGRGPEMFLMLSSWNEGVPGNIGGSTCILQARRTALVIGPGSIRVARRTRRGAWRFAICSLSDSGRSGDSGAWVNSR